MTESQARTVLRENTGSRICVRYCHDDAGKIRFRQPAGPTTCTSPRRVAWAGAMVMAAAMAACTPHQRPDEAPRVETTPAVTETVVQGQLPVIEPESEVQHAKGEIIAIEPEPEPEPELEPEYELLGDVIAEPPPPPEPIHAVKGDIAVPEASTRGGRDPANGRDEPCDGARTK